jgi:pimeloyl-ACP methyl ester carboxylesterase
VDPDGGPFGWGVGQGETRCHIPPGRAEDPHRESAYGGFVTANAATGDKNIKTLVVYVDAYIPAQGDTINSLSAQFPGSLLTPAALSFVPSAGGVTDAYVQPSMFHSIFANDRSAREAAVLAATQEPIAASALTAVSGAPAWATIPSWDVIGTADHAIPPAEQEFMEARAHSKVTKIDASHLSMLPHPGTVASVIEQAAHATS